MSECFTPATLWGSVGAFPKVSNFHPGFLGPWALSNETPTGHLAKLRTAGENSTQARFRHSRTFFPESIAHLLRRKDAFVARAPVPSRAASVSVLSCLAGRGHVSIDKKSIRGDGLLGSARGRAAPLLPQRCALCPKTALSPTRFCSCWRTGFSWVEFRPKGNSNIMPTIRSDMWRRIRKLAARERTELVLLSWSDSRKLPLQIASVKGPESSQVGQLRF